VSSPVLTAEQIEFAEIFERLERDFKMTKAAVSRALHIERSYVTMLIKGQRTPRIRTLEAMRELEKRQRVGDDESGAPEGDNELHQLFHQLKTLKDTDPPTFQVAKRVLVALVLTGSQPMTVATETC
jgi:transcriptional regulator with XRE-family HTH domain